CRLETSDASLGPQIAPASFQPRQGADATLSTSAIVAVRGLHSPDLVMGRVVGVLIQVVVDGPQPQAGKSTSALVRRARPGGVGARSGVLLGYHGSERQSGSQLAPRSRR